MRFLMVRLWVHRRTRSSALFCWPTCVPPGKGRTDGWFEYAHRTGRESESDIRITRDACL